MGYILEESDVDIRFLFTKEGSADIAARSVAVVHALRIGGATGDRRGLLLNFDTDRSELKVEVGYGLEAYLPDAFVSYLINHHAKMFFANGQRSVGLGLLLRIVQHRIREAILGQDFDPEVLVAFGPNDHLSGGAGVLASMPGPGADGHALKRSGTIDFMAGDTPSATYRTYVRLLAAPEWNPNADLFTAESRAYVAKLPMSRAYREYMLMVVLRKAWRVIERDDLALLYFTGTPFASPHFLRREDGVWRIDIMAELRSTRQHAGGVHTWSYVRSGGEYDQRFADLLVDMGGYYRIRDGDNRALPMARGVKR